MKKVLNILPKILIVLALLPLVGVNLAMGYIMFAPDSWPKPFYLMYQVPAQETTSAEATKEPAAEAPAASHSAQASASEEAPPAAQLEIKPGQGIMIDTGSKIVNLVDPTGRKYLRVGIVLEFTPTDLAYYTMAAEEKILYVTTFKEEVNLKLPVINDTIITMLASKTFEDVYTAEGKEKLRREILTTLNTMLPEYQVIYVYFTEFVVQ
jgi:flagellar protein FliL